MKLENLLKIGKNNIWKKREKQKSHKELPRVKLKGLYATQCIGTVYSRKQHLIQWRAHKVKIINFSNQ